MLLLRCLRSLVFLEKFEIIGLLSRLKIESMTSAAIKTASIVHISSRTKTPFNDSQDRRFLLRLNNFFLLSSSLRTQIKQKAASYWRFAVRRRGHWMHSFCSISGRIQCCRVKTRLRVHKDPPVIPYCFEFRGAVDAVASSTVSPNLGPWNGTSSSLIQL